MKLTTEQFEALLKRPAIAARNDPAWNAEDESWLIKNYPNLGQHACAVHLNRSDDSIRMKAFRLGLSLNHEGAFLADANKRAGESRSGKPLSDAHKLKLSESLKDSRAKNPLPPFSEEAKLKMSLRMKKEWKENRGSMVERLGKFTPERREKMSRNSKNKWADPTFALNQPEYRQAVSDRMSKLASQRAAHNVFSRCKSGPREDLGRSFRSSWEANYARYLNFLITNGDVASWKYEIKTFWFEPIKRGCRSYKPDFEVTFKDGRIEYHEVKGWMYPRGKTALKRMRKYHPEVTVVLVAKKEYSAIQKSVGKIIKNWEFPSTSR